MILLEFSIYPLDKGESVSKYVARAVDIVDRSGLPYHLHAMGTVIEGEWDECIAVVAKCFRALKKDCRRIEVVLKVDYRAGRPGRLSSKVASIQKRLGRALMTLPLHKIASDAEFKAVTKRVMKRHAHTFKKLANPRRPGKSL